MDEMNSLFLINIRIQPEELENMADEFPEKVSELQQEYRDWYARVK